MTLDEISEEVFRAFITGEIDRWEYLETLDILYDIMDESEQKALSRRLDSRGLGEFALAIYDNSRREALLVELWRKSYLKSGLFTGFTLENYGVDNRGKLIIENTSGRGGDADFVVDLEGPTLNIKRQKLEIKYSPTAAKATFKTRDLQNYIRNDVLVLIIVGPTKMIGPNGNPNLPSLEASHISADGLKWFMLSGSTMKKMLDELEVKQYRECGFKDSVQLLNKDFPAYFKVYDF